MPAPRFRIRVTRDAMPGRTVAVATTCAIVGVVVILPLVMVVAMLRGMNPAQIAGSLTSPRVMSSLELTVGASLLAAAADLVVGAVIAWTLVRVRFAGRSIVDALVDVPFALPTAVSGIALATLYGPNGWIGSQLLHWGIRVAYTPLGVLLALAFVGLPFVVRTVAPVLAALPAEYEEAAHTLGADRPTILRRVILPLLAPALSTGFALTLARGLGEYGSVVFISGNMPGRTEIAPLVIMTRLEAFDYQGAAALATLLLVLSFALLLTINGLQRRMAEARTGL